MNEIVEERPYVATYHAADQPHGGGSAESLSEEELKQRHPEIAAIFESKSLAASEVDIISYKYAASIHVKKE